MTCSSEMLSASDKPTTCNFACLSFGWGGASSKAFEKGGFLDSLFVDFGVGSFLAGEAAGAALLGAAGLGAAKMEADDMVD